MTDVEKCKICRRVGERLFLKGEKCSTPKCSILKKPHSPGNSPIKRRGKISEYGEELREVQKLKKSYNLRERQLKKIIRGAYKEGENPADVLISKLERRLDNVIYKVGLGKSRAGARQLISHGHFLLNGKRVNIPSIEVEKGDQIELREKSKGESYFKEVLLSLKKKDIPTWLSFDKNKKMIKVVDDPKTKEIGMKLNAPLVLSFYSKK